MNLMQSVFGTKKPIIAMCHIPALPGDPKYDYKKGMSEIVEVVQNDMSALQEGGVDAILFSNEFSMPYKLHADLITVAAMSRIIGEVKSKIRVPFGIDYMFDPKASIDIATVTGANFIRGIFSGTYSSDFGLWSTDVGETIRYIYQRRLEDNLVTLFSIKPQGSVYLGSRSIPEIISSLQFHVSPSAICMPAETVNELIDSGAINGLFERKSAIIVDGGCNQENIEQLFNYVDGIVIGTSLKKDGHFENAVDKQRVIEIMRIAKDVHI